MKLAVGTLNQTPLDWEGNETRIKEVIPEARAQGVSILCLPELCTTGYGCDDAFFSADVQQRAIEMTLRLCKETKGITVCIGLPFSFEGSLYNVAALLSDGKILGLAPKRFLAGEGIHYEPRWFRSWPVGKRSSVTVDGQTLPIGDDAFSIGSLKLGFEICEEAWVPERPLLKSNEPFDIILNPSASHFAFGKTEQRKKIVEEGSRHARGAYLYTNLLGNEAGRAIYDGGAMIATNGKTRAITPRFSFLPHQLLVYDTEKPQSTPAAEWESSKEIKEEEFSRAIALGLFDYLRKTHANGFVLSLSGGVDSASVACLVAVMRDLAVKELGSALFEKRLGSSSEMKRLLTCVYQSTENSSDITRNAARDVVKAVGADFFELDINPLVGDYRKMVSEAMGVSLDWKTHDVALQNVQARVRSPGIWLVANLKSALLLCASNRSEAAVGYATMDGDTSGGLSPIGAIDKAFLRKWLVWMEKEGPGGLHFPALKSVNEQAPTAELRPLASKQTDEADLMPYEILDKIERAFVKDRLSAIEILKKIENEGSKYARPQLGEWIAKFLKLWSRNQWKRERYAPAFHVDEESLDPKTWFRFPILSGGYEAEIEEMRAYIKGGSRA